MVVGRFASQLWETSSPPPLILRFPLLIDWKESHDKIVATLPKITLSIDFKHMNAIMRKPKGSFNFEKDNSQPQINKYENLIEFKLYLSHLKG